VSSTGAAADEPPSYRGYRYPVKIISHAVWLYLRWLWRAVDKHGAVLDILVQQQRDRQAADTFLQFVIASTASERRVVMTDQLLSYPPTLRRVLRNVDHRRHKGLNNRAENSHQPTRQALLTLWHPLRLVGRERAIMGWGRVLAENVKLPDRGP
jgi:transposase-like protein